MKSFNEIDRDYFMLNPKSTKYVRPYIPGELPPEFESLGKYHFTVVVKHATHIRERRFIEHGGFHFRN